MFVDPRLIVVLTTIIVGVGTVIIAVQIISRNRLREIAKQKIKNELSFKIKRIFLKILNFFDNIAGYFRQPERIKKIQENSGVLAISIKENLDNGNFNVINCLYDENAREIIDYENHALIIETESLDAQTISSFGIKDMIILK